MRPSNKRQILEAAIEIVEREGVTGVTYESVAEVVGMTKGGVMYHFPTRDVLILGMHQLMASTWEESMEGIIGKSAEEATPDERLSAYIATATSTVSRSELLLMLESVHNPRFNEPIHNLVKTWTPQIESESLSDIELQMLVARLASDGLWLLEAWTSETLPASVKQQVVDHINTSISKVD